MSQLKEKIFDIIRINLMYTKSDLALITISTELVKKYLPIS